LNAFLDHKAFNVSVITRATSNSTFPAQLKVLTSDFSEDSLLQVLKGQDAVVSVVGPGALKDQIPMIDAAEKAGVKRFIPSEFAATLSVREDLNPLQEARSMVLDHLSQKSKANPNFTHTPIATGSFIDWVCGLSVVVLKLV
jgi:putative NADH-flavin reductase